jgi:hypothetical protein
MVFRFVMEQQEKVSLDRLSFDEWVDFVFNKPLLSEGQKEWFWEEAYENFFSNDDQKILQHITKLISEPEFLSDKFSPAQIGQGFDCLQYGFDWADLLAKARDVPLGIRFDNIEAIEILYQKIFCKKGLERFENMLESPR